MYVCSSSSSVAQRCQKVGHPWSKVSAECLIGAHLYVINHSFTTSRSTLSLTFDNFLIIRCFEYEAVQIHSTWNPSNFSNLDVHFLPQIRDVFQKPLFFQISCAFSSPLFSGTVIMHKLVHFMLFYRSLRLSSFFFFLFL